MGCLKALVIAGFTSLAAIAPAAAADLLPQLPPPPPVDQYYEPVEFSGFYLRGDVGEGNLSLRGFQDSLFSYPAQVPGFGTAGYETGAQAIVGLGAGYQFNEWFRADVTGEYRTNSAFKSTEVYTTTSPNCSAGYNCADGYHGTISSAVFLVNGYVQLGTWYNLTPFAGVGAGTALNTFGGLTDTSITNPGGYGVAPNRTSANFAWALHGGVSYSLTNRLKLDFSYRYLNLGTVRSNAIVCNAACVAETQSYKMSSQDVRIGLRYMFADAPPPPPDLPLVRKY